MTDQRRHEAPDLGAAVFRMVRALVRRAAEGDTEALEQLAACERLTNAAVTVAMEHAHDGGEASPGLYSWTELGEVMGTTRQAARQRVTSGRVPGALREYLDRPYGG